MVINLFSKGGYSTGKEIHSDIPRFRERLGLPRLHQKQLTGKLQITIRNAFMSHQQNQARLRTPFYSLLGFNTPPLAALPLTKYCDCDTPMLASGRMSFIGKASSVVTVKLTVNSKYIPITDAQPSRCLCYICLHLI
jgi:hypothetical protein